MDRPGYRSALRTRLVDRLRGAEPGAAIWLVAMTGEVDDVVAAQVGPGEWNENRLFWANVALIAISGLLIFAWPSRRQVV